MQGAYARKSERTREHRACSITHQHSICSSPSPLFLSFSLSLFPGFPSLLSATTARASCHAVTAPAAGESEDLVAESESQRHADMSMRLSVVCASVHACMHACVCVCVCVGVRACVFVRVFSLSSCPSGSLRSTTSTLTMQPTHRTCMHAAGVCVCARARV